MKILRLTRRVVAAFVLIASLAPFCCAEEPVEDKTGKVFAGLADLASQASKVTQRYALLVTGEKHRLEPGKALGRQFYAGPWERPEDLYMKDKGNAEKK